MPRRRLRLTLVLSVTVIALAELAVRSGLRLPHLGGPVPTAEHPVVVELFDSQGCAKCPPAEVELNTLAERPEVLALSYAITYWDKLGWKDPYASDRFTARQLAYSDNGKGRLATPEFLINGTRTVIGSDRPTLDEFIGKTGPAIGGPEISADRTYVHIQTGPAEGWADTIWLVRYDPRTIRTQVSAGENSGRTLVQRNVVHELIDLGRWTGDTTLYALPPAREPGLITAVLVQRGRGGPIVSARRI